MKITKKYLRTRFAYKRKTGELIWKNHLRKARYVGTVAGTNGVNGYKKVYLFKKGYLLHRLIWIFFNGDISDGFQIDHIDGDKSNNRIENLRMATKNQNMWNRKAKGYRIKGNRFEVQLRHFGKYIHVGTFKTEDEAKEAYCKKCIELRGEFACT